MLTRSMIFELQIRESTLSTTTLLIQDLPV
jgi:hypothetical protein